MVTKRVLVVDDDPAMRLMFRVVLESGGYQVSEAHSGVAALILIKDALPDLVVTDMVMREVDGQELIARLRSDARTAHLPILAVTGHPGEREQASLADAVVAKPLDRVDLLATVNSLLEGTYREDQVSQPHED